MQYALFLRWIICYADGDVGSAYRTHEEACEKAAGMPVASTQVRIEWEIADQ